MATQNIGQLLDSVNEKVDYSKLNSTTILDPSQNLNPEGFTVPPTFAADGTGLPYTKTTSITGRPARSRRNIIHWFIPEFGVVKMFVNPSRIGYSFPKNIVPTRTKGGFTLQYLGENLPTLTISGNTASSGIEGINVLYEIYRAEQYSFDSVGLSLAARNAQLDVGSSLLNKGATALGAAIGGSGTGGITGGLIASNILGANSTFNSLAAKNIPSLAQLAFSVEMYYNGWVYRGYFNNFSFNESADNFLLDYSLGFTVTQRRGYRLNYLPFHKSPNYGPSQYGTPNSYKNSVRLG